MSEINFPGATAIGMACKGGVILAADRRASYGTFVMSKNARKVFRITDKIGIASAGLFSDIQTIVREAKYHANMFKLETHREMNARALAKLISVFLFSSRLAPLLTQSIIGGFSNGKREILVLDALGSIIEDVYIAVGSSAELVTGVLESAYREDLSIDESREIIKKAIKAALERDSSSGNGIDLLFITKDKTWEEFMPT